MVPLNRSFGSVVDALTQADYLYSTTSNDFRNRHGIAGYDALH